MPRHQSPAKRATGKKKRSLPWSGPIPLGPMSLRLAAKIIGGVNSYGVMRLIAEGELSGQKVHNTAGGHALQVLGESVAAYVARREAAPQRGIA